MFTGFNIKYPEYEVITPQTNLSFTMRSLNVQEEERMKGSLLTPQQITNHLNKCLFEAIVQKPATIKDFEGFLKSLTLKDRDALLYGLYHITYEEIRNYDITCSSCAKEYPITVQASSTFNFNSYPEKDILKKVEKIELPLSTGVSVKIKQPSLLDEHNAMKALGGRLGATNDMITETLIIDSFLEDIEESKEPRVYDDRQDIIDAYRSLPARDKRVIHEKYNDIFGQYGIELKMVSYCPHCGFEENVDIDLVTQFFRMVFSA